MSEPKPMDPKRLATLRSAIACGRRPQVWSEELLADRDYHEQRAEHFTTISCVMASMAGTIQEIARAAGWPEDVPVEDPGELVESVAGLRREYDESRSEVLRLRARVDEMTAMVVPS